MIGNQRYKLTLETRLAPLAGSLFIFHTRESLHDETLLLLLYLEDLNHEDVVNVRA